MSQEITEQTAAETMEPAEKVEAAEDAAATPAEQTAEVEAAENAENTEATDGAEETEESAKKTKKEKKQKEPKEPKESAPKQPNIFTDKSTRIYFFIALGALALAVICLALIAVPGAGVYTLTASIFLQIVALGLLARQKKLNDFKAVSYVTFATYIVLAACVILFTSLMIYDGIYGG